METPHKHKEYLELIATEINKRLPDNHGFILLAVPLIPTMLGVGINWDSLLCDLEAVMEEE